MKSRDRLIGEPGAILDGGRTASFGILGYGTEAGQNGVSCPGARNTERRRRGDQGRLGLVGAGRRESLERDRGRGEPGDGAPGQPCPPQHEIRVALEVPREASSSNPRRSRTTTPRTSAVGVTRGTPVDRRSWGRRAGTFDLIWRGNWVHDNVGNGDWSDGNVHAVLYEHNLVENNSGSGSSTRSAGMRPSARTSSGTTRSGRWAIVLVGVADTREQLTTRPNRERSRPFDEWGERHLRRGRATPSGPAVLGRARGRPDRREYGRRVGTRDVGARRPRGPSCANSIGTPTTYRSPRLLLGVAGCVSDRLERIQAAGRRSPRQRPYPPFDMTALPAD